MEKKIKKNIIKRSKRLHPPITRRKKSKKLSIDKMIAVCLKKLEAI